MGRSLLRLVVARYRPPIAVTARPLGANVSAKFAFTPCERPKRVDSNIEWQLMAPSLYDGSWPTFFTFPKIAIFGNGLVRIEFRQSVYSPEGHRNRGQDSNPLSRKVTEGFLEGNRSAGVG